MFFKNFRNLSPYKHVPRKSEVLETSLHVLTRKLRVDPITAPKTICAKATIHFGLWFLSDFIKYKSECDPESTGIRLSGTLSLHLLSGRGLRTGGRSQRRIRDLYCVVEVDHIHKARTVVRSGGVNFDWDEK